MTPEELLKPRVLVATDWPGRRDFEVGQIILLDKIFGDGSPMWEITDCQGTRTYIKKFFEMFPLQFKFLEWWEERDEKDMPKYVKSKSEINPTVKRLARLDLESDSKWSMFLHDSIVPYNPSDFLPATESEYNEYIKSKA